MQRIKKITSSAVALLLLAGLITSCSMEKRIYRPGFFVQHPSGKSKTTPPEKATALKEEPLSETASVSPQTGSASASPVNSEFQTNTEQAQPAVVVDKTVAEKGTKTVAADNADKTNAENKTSKRQPEKEKEPKLPLHPKLKAAGIFILAGAGFILALTLLVLLNNAFLFFSFPILLSIILNMFFRLAFAAVLIGGTLAVLGLLELKKQKEPIYGSKKRGILLLALAGIYPLYNFIRLVIHLIRFV